MQINTFTTYQVEGRVAIVTSDNPPVNALSAAVRQGLAAGVEKALADPVVGAIVLARASFEITTERPRR